jgi:hypothetical protein
MRSSTASSGETAWQEGHRVTPADIDTWKRKSARRRRIAAAAGIPVLVVALLSGYFYFSGGYDSWRTDRALADGCDGLLPVDEVRALFPRTALDTDDDDFDGGFCGVRTMHGGTYTIDLNVSIQQAPGKATSAYWDALPLGHGWTASFQVGNARDGADADGDYRWANVVMLLSCGDAPDDGLFIVVEAKVEGTFGDSATRTRLAAVATETAKRAAKQRNCKAKTGGPVTEVAKPLPAYKGLDQAKGTCAGLLDAAEARRLGLSTAQETSVEPAPNEQCVLGDSRRAAQYRLVALHGPLATVRDYDRNPEYARYGYHAAAAKCPGALGATVYVIEPVRDRSKVVSPLERRLLHTALESFAEQSAKRHACSTPEFQ